MRALNKLLGGVAVGLVLAAGLTLPALAQKLDSKNPPAPSTITATAGDLDFGDDTSEWAKDGECDDPRFEGDGTAAELVDADILKDATDCRAAYEAGTVTLKAGASDAPVATAAEIDFGDDSSEWAKDGECDDPRFEGTGTAAELVDADLLKDATDCRAAYEAGTVTLKTGASDAPVATTAEIDFGDDSSEWAKDGECDDPRFEGTGTAAELLDADIMKDATDCREAYEAGTVTFKGGASDTPVATTAEIDFGDDSSEWAKDGECDDPRFEGDGTAAELVDADLLKDATDCREAYEAGTVTLKGSAGDTPVATTAAAFDYGADWSKWAKDGECDDLRFTGPGTDKKLLSDDIYGDATDCRALEDEGQVTIRTVYTPEYAAGAPYDSSDIDFGDNTSNYADDDQCDDPRFEGPGAAYTLLDGDLKRDANDCKAAYEAGTIMLVDDAG